MKKALLHIIILCMLLVPGMALSENVLWDLVVQAHIDEEPVPSGHAPTVSGHVVDHAGRPVQGADIAIGIGALSFDTSTDENGGFEQELTGFDGIPGTHVVSIRSSYADMLGLASLELYVSGKIKQSEVLARQIGSADAQKYLQASEEEFSNDAIGMQVYQYYQGLYEEYQEALESEGQEVKADELNGQRDAAHRLLQEAMWEKNLDAGVYDGWRYERFVDNLDRSVRDMIVNQLNHTKTSLYEAREIMDSILESGGSHQEARDAYLDELSITQEMMAVLTTERGAIKANSTNSGQPAEEDEGNIQDLEVPETAGNARIPGANGTDIEVEAIGSSIFISIDGVIIEYAVNGTQLVQITNSTQ